METDLKSFLYQPIFSNILNNRAELAAIAGFGAVHIGLNMFGLTLWQCPILAFTGIPCPGCGLTRATMQLLHGDLAESFQTHAFALIFLSALLLMIAVLILPESTRSRLISFVRKLETRNGLTLWVLVSLMLYWAFRLIA